MGRLIYSARKIGGVKAGQTVSKDLKKRIPPGIGAKAAARDPTLEIDLTGKALTDEGFSQFIDDLLTCIFYRGEEHPTGLAKITEFHLSGNNLTVLSLPKLGEVVAHSAGDLRELDLSRNEICVASAQEKAIWKAFLECFKNCYVLSKLDLSENPIGPTGLEILCCVYIKSDVDFLEADAAAIVGLSVDDESTLVEEVSTLKVNENDSPRANRAKKTVGKGKAAKQNGTSQTSPAASKNITAGDLKKFACTRGLRAIPYLILSNIDLTMSSAIHFSHMLAIQRSSEQLLNFLPPGKASDIPEAAQSDKCIIWKPNDSIPTFATRLLEVAESVREFKSKAESELEASSDDEDTQRKMQSKMMHDYTRLTKRVRLESLKVEGIHCSDIVIAALKMLVLSRALLLEDKDRPVEESTEEETTPAEEDAQEEEVEKEVEPEKETVIYPAPTFYPPANLFFELAPQFSLGPFDRANAMFDEDFPALTKPTPRKLHPIKEETEQQVKESEESAQSSPSASTSPNQPGRSGRGNSRNNRGRKQEWRFGLPFEIWRRIIADAVGVDGVLDIEQQTRIIQYASDWKAVAYELSIKGYATHQQVWKFLETVGCFTYTPLP
ncbi:hypothetical protein BJX68DRAFT_278548 [Aspergillus pseudodeflectus]|uniref:Leucine rich repeat protein n=1 Tax=Aspergillus pseudodeflectus TaxID=176178 RepID=A0ABR4JPQ9_9EURO